MGLLRKAINKAQVETGANYSLGHSLSQTAVSTLTGNGDETISPIAEYTGFVWKAISTKAMYLSDQRIFVERKVGDKWQEAINHDFDGVLDGEDGGLDQSELLEAHAVIKEVYGEVFWYISKGERMGKPFAIYLLDPAAMTIMVANERVTGYVYQKDGERVLFELDEIKHFKYYNPANTWRGKSPLQAAGIFVKSSRYVNTYVNNFLENNAIPAGVVVAKSDVNDADWQLFKDQWVSRYSGIDNSGKTGFVRGSDLDFVQTGLSLGDVDFSIMKEVSRDDILVMLGVSKPIMNIFDDINRASAVTAQQLFAQSYTSPELKAISRKLSRTVAKAYGPEFRVGNSNPVPEDRELKLKEYANGVGKWFTPNEAREAYGEDAITGGDKLEAVTSSSSGELDATKSAQKVKIKLIAKSNKGNFTYEMKESFRSEMQSVQEKYEQSYLKAVQPVLKEQKEAVLKQIAPKKVKDAKIDAEAEATKMTNATINVFVSLAKEQGLLAAQFAGNKESSFDFTKVMEKYIRDSIQKAALGFTKETEEAISKALQEGLEAGESLAKIADRIDTIYDDVLGVKTAGYRIERIARTEVIKTSNEITEAAYKQSGVVSKKEWITNPGACQFCKSLDGNIISLGSTFLQKGSDITGTDGGTYVNTYEDVKHPPTHPDCRCGLVPVIEDSK